MTILSVVLPIRGRELSLYLMMPSAVLAFIVNSTIVLYLLPPTGFAWEKQD